jgi:hypothetical protein
MYSTTPHWYLIQNTYLLTDTPQPDVINLSPTKWAAMRYDQTLLSFIDFPGEYDIQDHGIVCYDAWGYLHYQLITDDGIIVLIQDPALLEKETIGEVETWLCTSEKTKDAIERDELEWTIIVMEWMDFTSEA